MLNGPQKIILIRAGRYDYAEIELGASIQIVGPNNTGKTTLINTLQFLYLNDLRTTDFGSYSLEQTLSYYFPNQYSHVLFQCLGASGQCVIGWRGQSKASGGDPERFYYQGPFETADYFDEKRQVREPRDISARLAFKQFHIIKSAQEHRELLLPAEGAGGIGQGIVALRDADRFPRFRESLKDLLSLSTITQEQMRDRLLTLAGVRTDVPALDVRRLFGEDYDLIRRRRDALLRFKKQESGVRKLVEQYGELAQLRGELIARWDDLRNKRTLFEQTHTSRLAELREEITKLDVTAQDCGDQLKDRGAERDAQLADKGGLTKSLADLDVLSKRFVDFDPNLARAAEQNLKNEELRLKNLLGHAATESRDKARLKVELYQDQVRHKEQTITDFDRLAVTALRRHFSDPELERAFRILNFELLETPVGPDGIAARDENRLLKVIRDLAGKVRDGAYEDDTVRILLRSGNRSTSDLPDVNTLNERLREDRETLRHWEAVLKAIAERDQLAEQLASCQKELTELQHHLFAHGEFMVARAEEPRLRRDLKLTTESIEQLSSAINDLQRRQEEARKASQSAQNAVRDEENAFNAIMGRFNQCLFPGFSEKRLALLELPHDFDGAIALYLHRQKKEQELRQQVETVLKLVAQAVGEEFNGAEDSETIRNLASELEALADKTDALGRDWNALIQGLRGTFDGVLKELDAVRSSVTDLNRQFSKIQVSNLKSIKLEVLDSGDLVSWIKRLVDLEQPGLFDDDTNLDQTLRNFRQKLEGSPLISFAQLFSLQFTVVGEDGVPHHHQDFRQIESHGTTITVKVLFNLLILRRYLREDRCVVPFFLDEIQALDPANRAAVLSTARLLGFIAITAAPEPVTEVEALYFLQPHQGRIVLHQRHRVGVKLAVGRTRPQDPAKA